MPSVVWRAKARANLVKIISYIADRNQHAAERLDAAIQHTAEQLPAHPFIHRPGRIPGTREAVVHPNYLLIYRVAEDIEILTIVHARQQYP
jgi:addiction module RelE/StbE family toxin